MTIIGVQTTLRILQRDLPPVTLLSAPGYLPLAADVATQLADHHRVSLFDRFTASPPLSVDSVRDVIDDAALHPYGAFRLFTLPLDDASTAALNALLKTLEQPPATVRFILTASRPTLPTVTSRAQLFQLAAPQPDGHDDHTSLQTPREHVTALVRALAAHDLAGFERSLKTWGDLEGHLLITLLCEAITGRWSTFAEADAYGLRRDQATARRMLLALSTFPAARSRLGVRAALEPFVTS